MSAVPEGVLPSPDVVIGVDRTRRPGLLCWSPPAWSRRVRSASRPTATAIGSFDAGWPFSAGRSRARPDRARRWPSGCDTLARTLRTLAVTLVAELRLTGSAGNGLRTPDRSPAKRFSLPLGIVTRDRH